MNFRRNIELFSFLGSHNSEFAHMDEPYITCVDAEQEFVVIYNPKDEYCPLDHYSIADGKMHHTFKFPRRCKIPPRTEYCIYTCPGAPSFDHGSLMEYHVLWTNHDGSLRRMEVLNNDKCCVKLLNPKGEIISQCETGMENPQATERRRLQELRNSPMFRLFDQVQTALLYIRVLALVGMAAACGTHSAAAFITLFWISLACDLLSRGVIGRDPALANIALLGDRLSSLVLTCCLLFLLHNPHSEGNRTPQQSEEASTPPIRLGAIAFYTSESAAADNSTMPEPVAAASAMAWVGMFVPGLARRTLWVSLVLELLAASLNPEILVCPKNIHAYGLAAPVGATADIQEDEQEAQELSERLAHEASNKSVEDAYSVIGQISPVLLTVLCVAADYYQVHCFTSYHYKYELGEDGAMVGRPSPLWMYDLWVLAAALGCAAYNVKLVNNASLVGSAVLKMVNKK